MIVSCKLVALDWDERTITLKWPDDVPSLIATAVSVEVDLSPLLPEKEADDES